MWLLLALASCQLIEDPRPPAERVLPPPTHQTDSLGLEYTHHLATAGERLAIGDGGGQFMWWSWTGEPGPVVHAHWGRGAVASGEVLLTHGMWNPRVVAWEPGVTEPLATWQPFDAIVMGACSAGETTVIAGAFRAPLHTDKDWVPMFPPQVAVYRGEQELARFLPGPPTEIEHLGCGEGWILAGDRHDLYLWQDGRARHVPLPSPRVQAVSEDSPPLVAVDGAIYELDLEGATLEPLPGSSRTDWVYALTRCEGTVWGAGPEEVWSLSGQSITREGIRPLDLVCHQSHLVVLWEDRELQRLEDGQIQRSIPVPRP